MCVYQSIWAALVFIESYRSSHATGRKKKTSKVAFSGFLPLSCPLKTFEMSQLNELKKCWNNIFIRFTRISIARFCLSIHSFFLSFFSFYVCISSSHSPCFLTSVCLYVQQLTLIIIIIGFLRFLKQLSINEILMPISQPS